MPICLVLGAAAGLGAEEVTGPAEEPAIRLQPAPPPATTRLMHRWHRRYRRQISPVLRQWDGLAQVTGGQPGSSLVAGCRRLGAALERLDEGPLPAAPDAAVSLHLEETLRSLARAARSCTHGAYFLTLWQLQEADDSWRELRGRLLLYGLTP